MFGVLTPQEIEKEYNGMTIPCYFNHSLLPKLEIDQIVFFDETHISQKDRLISRSGIQIRFPGNSIGVYTPVTSESSEVRYNDRLKQPTFKYEKEARFLLGVCVTKDTSGNYIGFKIKADSYTMKTIVSILGNIL